MNRTPPLVRALQYAALACYVVFLGFPLFWLFTTSFKPPQELSVLEPTVLPQHWTTANFAEAFRVTQLPRALLNSLIVATATAVITTLIAMPASYALARFRSRLRTVAVGWILVSQLFPFILLVIPLFIMLKNFALIDTLAGLVLVYVTWSLPFTLWMLQGYVAAIPVDLEEAAATDGASRLTTLRIIIFPLLMPGVVATAMFAMASPLGM